MKGTSFIFQMIQNSVVEQATFTYINILVISSNRKANGLWSLNCPKSLEEKT